MERQNSHRKRQQKKLPRYRNASSKEKLAANIITGIILASFQALKTFAQIIFNIIRLAI